jgi:hypothetical protein
MSRPFASMRPRLRSLLLAAGLLAMTTASAGARAEVAGQNPPRRYTVGERVECDPTSMAST